MNHGSDAEVATSLHFQAADLLQQPLFPRFDFQVDEQTPLVQPRLNVEPTNIESAMNSAVNSGMNIVEPTISIVIPAKNEAKNLPHVLPQIPEWVHEVLLVDGNSTDGTVDVARQLLPNVRIIQQHGRGKGAALRSGFAAATGDIIVMLDADGSMNPAEIPAFIGALLTGADFAKGSRFLQGGGTFDMSWLRFLGNLGLTWLVRLAFGGQYSDLCYGYNAFWRRVLPQLDLCANGFEIETQMNVRALHKKLKVSEVPSFEALRIHGESNLNTFRDGWRVLKTIALEWWTQQQLQQPILNDSPPAMRPFHAVARVQARRK